MMMIILCLIMKRRVKFLSLIFLTFFVVLFSLFTPNGKILFSFYIFNKPFNITQGALLLGLQKSGVLILLHLISKFIISFDFINKNKFSFVSNVLTFYNALTSELNLYKNLATNSKNKKNSFKSAFVDFFSSLFNSIDEKLIKVWEEG